MPNIICTKEDVRCHRDGVGRPAPPALNVKCYKFPDIYDVTDRFGCTEDAAEHALEFAWESAVERFWEEIPGVVEEIFDNYSVSSSSAGRSGGWLIVEGLPPVRDWDAVLLAKWRKLARIVDSEVGYLSSWEHVEDAIDMNKWHLDGAEQYNFVDLADGSGACIAELRQKGGILS